MAAPYAIDTFTDVENTGLASHTADLGGVWTLATGAQLQIGSNRARGTTATTGGISTIGSAQTGGVFVECDIFCITDNDSHSLGPVLFAATNNFWTFRVATSGNTYQVVKNVAGVQTTIYTSSPITLTAATNVARLRIEKVGTIVRAMVDGVEVYRETWDVVGNPLAGLRQFGTGSATVGLAADNFNAGTREASLIVVRPERRNVLLRR